MPQKSKSNNISNYLSVPLYNNYTLPIPHTVLK